jgi:hypothetical protein
MDALNAIVTVIVAALVRLVLLLPLAGELGRRSTGGASAA